jgi:hypothetical protein
MAKAGRKRKLTRTVIDNFCAALEYGATLEIAAGYAQVSLSSIYNWLDIGEKEEERLGEGQAPDADKDIYVQFARAVTGAKATAAVSWLQVLDQHARIDPAWAKFMLQVRYPGDFSPVQRSDITSDGEAVGSLSAVFMEALGRAYGDDDDGDGGDAGHNGQAEAAAETDN